MATPNGRRHRWISSISILHIPWQIHYKANRAAQRTDLHIILHTQLQIVRSRGLNPIRVRSWWWTGCLWRKASFVSDNLTIAHLYYTRTRTHTNTQSTLGERCCEEGSNCVKLLCDYNAVLTSAHMKREIIYWYSPESQQIMFGSCSLDILHSNTFLHQGCITSNASMYVAKSLTFSFTLRSSQKNVYTHEHVLYIHVVR